MVEQTLKKKGFYVSKIECYKRIFKNFNSIIAEKKWSTDKINTLVVTSAETLYRLSYLFLKKQKSQWLLKCKIIVVEKRLAILAQKIGWTDIVTSKYANNRYLLTLIQEIRLRS